MVLHIPLSKDRATSGGYVRNGTRSIFLFTGPLAGWRWAGARPQRTRRDWAGLARWLLDAQYPAAEKAVPVLDNLNTHTAASLYEAFGPAGAFRLARRLGIHYTPKHGSWLNIAGIELSALSAQALGDRRIPCIGDLNRDLGLWHTRRNAA